jgi:Asp-tRNA(Asn)/Glu-tRNA(Gln) amidotransferase A subunit family amidase
VPDDLTWLPAWAIRDLISKREVSPVEVTEHFLGRIEELDGQLQTFASLDAAGAREQAKRAEAAVRNEEELGPLHGIPVSVKEHIAVAGLPVMDLNMTWSTAGEDDIPVERLRKAGAVIFGTNTMLGSGAGVNAASMMGEDGAPPLHFNWDVEARNAWDRSRVPGWSSSGGAAAAVARLVPITIGSDGGGSTRLPAAYSGVIGVHPQQGRLPHVDYKAPALQLTGTIGPLCRHVRDAAITTQVLAGPDGRDFVCLQEDAPDYTARLDVGVDGLRFSWTDDFGFTGMYAGDESPRVISLIRDAAFGFRSIGAHVDESSTVWEDYFPGNFTYARIFPMAGEGEGVTALPRATQEEYREAAEARRRNWETFKAEFQSYDLLLSPTAQLVAPTVEAWDRAWTTETRTYPHGNYSSVYTSHTAMFNWLGWPAVSVPCGFVDGLPVGLQLIGQPGTEPLILRAAQAFEQAFPRDERPPIS